MKLSTVIALALGLLIGAGASVAVADDGRGWPRGGGGGAPVANAVIAPASINTNFIDAGSIIVANSSLMGSPLIITGTAQIRGVSASGSFLDLSATNAQIGSGSIYILCNSGTGKCATPSGTIYSSAQASGSNAYEATVNGARFDFGAGASDYASSDGTTVTFAGPVKAATFGFGGDSQLITNGNITAHDLEFNSFAANSAGACANVFGNQNALTAGNDRFPVCVYSDSLSTRVASFASNGSLWTGGNVDAGTETLSGFLAVAGISSLAVVDAGTLSVAGLSQLSGIVNAAVVDAGTISTGGNIISNGFLLAQVIDAGTVSVAGLINNNMGTSTSSATMVGTANVGTASTGNGGSCVSGVDLITYTLPANALVTTGRCIRIKGWGTLANNATAKNIDFALGAGPTTLITKAMNVSLAGETWDAVVVICRTGSSAQTVWAEAFNNAGITVSSTDGATVLKNTNQTTTSFTETSSQLLRFRCITNANAANDIVQKGLVVEYL